MWFFVAGPCCLISAARRTEFTEYRKGWAGWSTSWSKPNLHRWLLINRWWKVKSEFVWGKSLHWLLGITIIILKFLTQAEKEAKRFRRVLANRESARRTIRRRQVRIKMCWFSYMLVLFLLAFSLWWVLVFLVFFFLHCSRHLFIIWVIMFNF